MQQDQDQAGDSGTLRQLHHEPLHNLSIGEEKEDKICLTAVDSVQGLTNVKDWRNASNPGGRGIPRLFVHKASKTDGDLWAPESKGPKSPIIPIAHVREETRYVSVATSCSWLTWNHADNARRLLNC